MLSMVETRPDIAFATSVMSRFAKNPSRQHTEAVKTIMQYLKATKTVGITYGGNEGGGNLTINGYSGSDWAGDHSTRKSTSGFIFVLNGGPVSWCSKRQATVALSSTKAEYVALTLAAKRTHLAKVTANKSRLTRRRRSIRRDQGDAEHRNRANKSRRCRGGGTFKDLDQQRSPNRRSHNSSNGSFVPHKHRQYPCLTLSKRRQPRKHRFGPQFSTPRTNEAYRHPASLYS